MANVNGLREWWFAEYDDFWTAGVAEMDRQVDAEFERLKAERLARAQARLLADLNLDEDINAWKHRRLAAMQKGLGMSATPQSLVPSPFRLLWLAAMFAAIAIGIVLLAARITR